MGPWLHGQIEDVLGIRTCPVNWPIGCGKSFKGVYDRFTKKITTFTAAMGEMCIRDSGQLPPPVKTQRTPLFPPESSLQSPEEPHCPPVSYTHLICVFKFIEHAESYYFLTVPAKA